MVTSVRECEEIVSLLYEETVLAIDCQGVYRRSHLRLTLLQIGTSKGDVYLFDVHENRDLLLEGSLRVLLESEEIEKVCNFVCLCILLSKNKIKKILCYRIFNLHFNFLCRWCLSVQRIVVLCTTIFKLLCRTSLIYR